MGRVGGGVKREAIEGVRDAASEGVVKAIDLPPLSDAGML